MKVCGIDPGNSGGVAFVEHGKAIVYDMPRKELVDFNLLRRLLEEHKPDMVIVEKQGVTSVTGRKSAFVSGRNYERVLFAVAFACADIPLRTVRAQEWKRTLGVLGKKADSERTKKLITKSWVERNYPGAQLTGPRGGFRDGRADAIAIAHYGIVKFA